MTRAELEHLDNLLVRAKHEIIKEYSPTLDKAIDFLEIKLIEERPKLSDVLHTKQMTKEKAIKLAIKACEETWNEKTCKQIRKALEQEPCDKYINEIDHLRKYISKLETQIVEQEPKYCDRNICVSNEYNGIGCDECEVTKSQEPSGDLIRRQVEFDLCNMRDKYKVKNVITVNPQEPKTGHWIHFATSDDCSECGWSTGKYISPSKFCPNCGAKLESEE